MVFNTLSVATAVTPSVIETSLSHYLNRKPLHHKPTAHISYHVGLRLVRQFLDYASHHTVEDVQGFTAQWVPSPRWVHVEEVKIAAEHIKAATQHIQTQLGPYGLEAVGGVNWWQWRPESRPLGAEWIEMRKDYNAHRQKKEDYTRSMLYVHGGAYYFGSVDEHRYQMQRHARKLQARVLAPRYRLAPQYPFPCGLLDCLAAYLYLLTVQPPETIILAGDSAGGGMVVSLLVILRDQDIPLPAGAILLSPWVDLTHSFPSVAGENALDYVPPHGFLHRPSMGWPPPNSDDLRSLRGLPMTNGVALQKTDQQKAQGFTVNGADGETAGGPRPVPHTDDNLSITIDDKSIEIKDQIQMYTTNALLSHPLVSPVLQPSLGGLPPLCIIVGGGEMLRDEQIYLAHKAAAPSQYPPSDAALSSQNPGSIEMVNKYPPTYVQLQVWDDMCHVAPTLSFTRPAKFMYRSVAQFGAWALARAQQKDMAIVDDDDISVISSTSSSGETTDTSASSTSSSPGFFSKMRSSSRGQQDNVQEKKLPPTSADASAELIHKQKRTGTNTTLTTAVGKAGDALPPFTHHMIRQRVTRHGEIFPLAPANELPACTMEPAKIGVIKPGPVRKWMAAQEEWARRYSKEKRAIQEQRLKDMKSGYAEFKDGDVPPPSAMVGRRTKEIVRQEVAADSKGKRSHAMTLWSGWGSAHDEDAIEREEEREKVTRRIVRASRGAGAGGSTNTLPELTVDVAPEPEPETMAPLIAEKSNQRPAIGNQAFPFKLAVPVAGDINPSTTTLHNAPGVIDPPETETTSQPAASHATEG